MKSYRDLDIYKLSYKLAIEIHHMSLTLPKYELYEQGSQVRRSSKSVKDNIVEGYGRRRYKADYIKFLIYAHSSCDEAISQLNMISDIHFPGQPLTELMKSYDELGRKINRFIRYVEDSWKWTDEASCEWNGYPVNPDTRNPLLESRQPKKRHHFYKTYKGIRLYIFHFAVT